MPQLPLPKSYAEARNLVGRKPAASSNELAFETRAGKPARVTIEAGGLAWDAELPVIEVTHRGEPFAAFYPDGRIKLITYGSHTHAALMRINAVLPPHYRVRKRGSHLYLLDSRLKGSPISVFLSSATFTPEPSRRVAGRAAAQRETNYEDDGQGESV
jgi:hypothetical protein